MLLAQPNSCFSLGPWSLIASNWDYSFSHWTAGLRLFWWLSLNLYFSSVQSLSGFDCLRPHGLQHARFLCPSPTPGACSSSCPLSRWCHPYKQSDMTEPLHFQQMGEGKLTHVGLSWGHSPWDARHFLSHSVLVTWLLGPTQIVLGWEMTTLASSHPSCLLALRWTIWYLRSKFSSLCCCSVAKSCPNLCDPIAAYQASLSFAISQSLLKLTSIELMTSSKHLILCHPLLLPSIFPSIRVFSSVSALRQVAKVGELQLQHQSFQWIFRIDFL